MSDALYHLRVTAPRGAGVQFFYPNESDTTAPLTIEVTGLVSDEEIVTFQVDNRYESLQRIFRLNAAKQGPFKRCGCLLQHLWECRDSDALIPRQLRTYSSHTWVMWSS